MLITADGVLCLVNLGSSFSDQVFQSPSNILSSPKGTAKIFCLHNIPNYNLILWYKQEEKQLLLLGYVYYGNAYPEAGANVMMDGSADKNQNCTLTVEQLSLKSSAVYFCAARYHSATNNWSLEQKPHLHMYASLVQRHAKTLTPARILLIRLSSHTSLPPRF